MLALWHRGGGGTAGGNQAAAQRAFRRAQQHVQHYQASHLHLGVAFAQPRRCISSSGASASFTPAAAAQEYVTIGDVRVARRPRTALSRPDLIPSGYLASALAATGDSQETLQSLRWLMQKDLLRQDVFLLGPPGPQKRQLAMRFGEVVEREVEYVSISRDTTEADLKQRAEVVRGSLKYVDQSPVRCALFGRILILDGLEKAERNVLPTLNNLLENREMSLEDGRFLMHHSAYDALLTKGLTQRDLTERKLLRCHEDFRVIALGLPVPRYPGYPLDPPLRSRFQARAVLNLPLVTQMEVFRTKYPLVDRELLVNLLSARETLRIFEAENANTSLSTAPGAGPAKMPHFSSASMEVLVKVLNELPVEMQRRYVNAATVHSVYPFSLLCDTLQTQTVYEALDRFHVHRAVRHSTPDQTPGRMNHIVFPDLTREEPTLWITGEPRVVKQGEIDQGLELVETPMTLTSTPEQVLEQVAMQQRLPTSELGVVSNSIVVERKSSDVERKQRYRLPQGKLLSLTLTTSPPGFASPSADALTHTFTLQGAPGDASLPLPSTLPGSCSSSFVATSFHQRLLAPILLSFAAGKDVCLIGGRGIGKTSFARWFAERYLLFRADQVHTVHLFRDMSSRDLLQRRSTDTEGNTVWSTTEIVNAVLSGGCAILDGLERVPPATMQVLRRLIEDRELTLFDGTRLMRHDRYLRLLETHTPAQLTKLRVFPVLPSFRIIALACPPAVPGAVSSSSSSDAGGSSSSNQTTSWLLEETLPLFSFHSLGALLPGQAQEEILAELFPHIAEVERKKVMGLVEHLSAGRPPVAAEGTLITRKSSGGPLSHAGSSFTFSLRQCIQLLTHYSSYPSDLIPHVRRMLLYEFLPRPQKDMVENLIGSSEYGSTAGRNQEVVDERAPTMEELTPRVINGHLHIGAISYPLSTRTTHPELVPRIRFTQIASQMLILQDLIKDWLVDGSATGETVAGSSAISSSASTTSPRPFSHRRHLLLIGNQGTGKNKITDYLLQLLHMEREYMQLHRDTTVQSLTLSPSLSDGRITYEDSSLVRSVRLGRVLVVDEADKAPLEVISILKSLVQDGEMSLSDGRRIVANIPRGYPASATAHLIPIHPHFKLIVLANRPGYPFHGNDFFKAVGDVFAVHSVPNPEPDSEVELLRSYGPDVPLETIRTLVQVFSELRQLVLEGQFTYPYSTRELVAIVRHLQLSRSEGLLDALDNVLDFDRFDADARRNLKQVFARHGIPLMTRGQQAGVEVQLAESEPLPQPKLVQTWTKQRGGGLTANATSGSSTSMTGGAATPGLGKRLMHTASATFSAITGTSAAVDPPSPPSSASFPSLLSSTPLTARSWTLHLEGQVRTNESYGNARMQMFSEEKASFKVPLTSSVSRPLAMATLSDDSLHILTSSYLCLHSYFPGHLKYATIELEDFLPMYEIPEDTVQMVGMEKQLLIFAPTHNMLLIVAYPKSTPTADQLKTGHLPVPKCTVSVVALQPPAVSGGEGNKHLSNTFLEYLTPGFKMPKWSSRGNNNDKDSPPSKPVQIMDALSSTHGLVVLMQPQARFFMLMDLSGEAIKKAGLPGASMVKGQHLSSNQTLAVTKLGSLPIGVLSVIDLAALPVGAYIEKLVSLSPSMWLVETNLATRYISSGPSDGWKWIQLENTPAGGKSQGEGKGSFVAHESGWHYTPTKTLSIDQLSPGDAELLARGAFPRRYKPMMGTEMEHLEDIVDSSSTAGGIAQGKDSFASDIPSAQAIFIPRTPLSPSTSASSSTPPANILSPFAKTSTLLTPPSPSSLYRFGAGVLFDEASQALNGSSTSSSLYEVPLPHVDAATAIKNAESAEATYHSWLSTLLPTSSQLAMPSYFTYHMPPPSASDSNNIPWISKIQQPAISVIDLHGRRIAHVPLRAHPSDSSESLKANTKISVEKFMSIGAASRSTPSASSFRSRREAEEAALDPGLDEQAMEESLGAEASKATATDPARFVWARDRILALRTLPASGDLVTLQANGRVRVFEVDPVKLGSASTNWRRLFGLSNHLVPTPLRLDLASDRKRDASAPKVGKTDKDNKPHVGGNQWRGGTGGSDTAGLGGKAGPYRFDAGHDVHQMAPEEKAKVSAEVAAAAKALGQAELAKRLGAIDLAAEDHALYSQYQAKVLKQIHQLRVILEQAEARTVEREWVRNQKDGDLDDNKIVDAMTGERKVYRRRGLPVAQSGAMQRLPKRLHFVMDVSGSMYRFNGSDQRLERLLEATLLIMEALEGFEQKYSYSIVGHSGDAAAVPFVPYGAPPKTRKDRLKVLQRMYAHSQYCSSGDNTLEGIRAGLHDVVQSEADDYLVIIVSDANLRRYGIAPHQITSALTSDPRVNAYIIYLASLQDEIARILPAMPPGRAFFCAETADLPPLFRTLLQSSEIIAK